MWERGVGVRGEEVRQTRVERSQGRRILQTGARRALMVRGRGPVTKQCIRW